MKKDVFFTGDVLNVTARLQGLCKIYHKKLLLSGDLAGKLSSELESAVLENYCFEPLGKAAVRGRSEPIEVYAVHPSQKAQ